MFISKKEYKRLLQEEEMSKFWESQFWESRSRQKPINQIMRMSEFHKAVAYGSSDYKEYESDFIIFSTRSFALKDQMMLTEEEFKVFKGE